MDPTSSLLVEIEVQKLSKYWGRLLGHRHGRDRAGDNEKKVSLDINIIDDKYCCIFTDLDYIITTYYYFQLMGVDLRSRANK